MNIHQIFLAFQLTVGLPEIIISLLVAIILGFAIQFFLNSRKTININTSTEPETIGENDNWKLKYYNDMDMQEKAQQQLRERLAETRENEQVLTIEVEELHKKLDELEHKLYNQPPATENPVAQPAQIVHGTESVDYLAQLRSAQENLSEHNNKVNRLLEQIELLKESENKYAGLLKENEQLSRQLDHLRQSLAEKEDESNQLRQQRRITDEMSERLNKAYSDFNLLQDKLQKLENKLSNPQKGPDYEQLHESYFRLTKDYDEARQKQISLWEENQRLSRILSDTEDKLRESNFQRMQFQKKVSFLEELNNDLQQVSEHHKKIDNQLRRINEMETILSKTANAKSHFEDEEGK